MSGQSTELSSFHKALQETPEAIRDLTPMTYWRYVNGQFPKALDWLFKYPGLLRALASDAEAHRQAVTASEN